MARRTNNFQSGPREPEPTQADIDNEVVESLGISQEYQLPRIDLQVDGQQVKITRLILTPEIVAVALYEARGAVSVAAKKLSTTVRIVNRYIRDYELCATA